MFGECLKRAEVAARTFAMPDAVRTWLPPAEPAESQSPAEPVDAPAPPSLGAVLAEAAETVDAPAPPSLGDVLAKSAEPAEASAPPSLGAVLAEAAEPAESQSPAEFSTPPTQPEAFVLGAGGPCLAGGGWGQGRHGRSPQGGRRAGPVEAWCGSFGIPGPRQAGREGGGPGGSGARVRAPACVRGSAVGARTQVDATRVGVPARERTWRVRGRVCGVGVRVWGHA
jgi:hypothetical protein